MLLLSSHLSNLKTKNSWTSLEYISSLLSQLTFPLQHCLEFDPQKRFNPDQALAHEWIIEGLPAQLQAQHLKFIKDTASPVDPMAKESPSSPTSKQSEPKSSGRIDHSISQSLYNPDTLTLRSQYVTEKSQVPHLSLRANTQNTQEDQSIDRSGEVDSKIQGPNKQKKTFTRKVTLRIIINKTNFSLDKWHTERKALP